MHKMKQQHLGMIKKSAKTQNWQDDIDIEDDFLASRIEDINVVSSIDKTIENLQHNIKHLELVKELYPDVNILPSFTDSGYSFASKSVNAIVDQFDPSIDIEDDYLIAYDDNELIKSDKISKTDVNHISSLHKMLKKRRKNESSVCNCVMYVNIDVGCNLCHQELRIYAMPAVIPLFFLEDGKNTIHVSFYKEFIDKFGINPLIKEKLTLYLLNFIKTNDEYDLSYLPAFINSLLLFS